MPAAAEMHEFSSWTRSLDSGSRLTRSRARGSSSSRPCSQLPAGHWDVPHGDGSHGRLGYLVLEGLLARDMTLAGRTATELLGEGDVVQPWLAQREEGLSPTASAGTC